MNQQLICYETTNFESDPMTTGNEYVLHINFDEIEAEIAKFQQMNKELAEKITIFLCSLKETTARIEPTLRKETYNERELWEDYKQLQREKLAVLDLSHEWDYIDQSIKDINPKLDFLVKDAIEELRSILVSLQRFTEPTSTF